MRAPDRRRALRRLAVSGPHDSEPTVWALTVDEEPPGPPVAEVFVEVGSRWYGDLLADAIESGFLLAAGEPPDSTGTLLMNGAEVERLLLVGGRQSWEPVPHPLAAEEWRTAARENGEVLVIVVPPGTWRAGTEGLTPDAGADELSRNVATACETGVVLHGTARLAVR